MNDQRIGVCLCFVQVARCTRYVPLTTRGMLIISASRLLWFYHAHRNWHLSTLTCSMALRRSRFLLHVRWRDGGGWGAAEEDTNKLCEIQTKLLTDRSELCVKYSSRPNLEHQLFETMEHSSHTGKIWRERWRKVTWSTLRQNGSHLRNISSVIRNDWIRVLWSFRYPVWKRRVTFNFCVCLFVQCVCVCVCVCLLCVCPFFRFSFSYILSYSFRSILRTPCHIIHASNGQNIDPGY